jgi:hypothetical protein
MRIDQLKEQILALEKSRVILRESSTFRFFGKVNTISLVAVAISYVLIIITWVRL